MCSFLIKKYCYFRAMNKLLVLSLSACLLLLCGSCGPGRGSRQSVETAVGECFTNPIRQSGSSPCLVYADGMYYYTQSTYVRVSLWASETIAGLKDAQEHVVYTPDEAYYISGTRLYRFNDRWYIYYSSDDGDLSRRSVHVLENVSRDPLEGEFVHKGVIRTGNQKSFHPSVFEHRGHLYFFWSGYDASQKGDIDVSHIYASRMSDPWTLDSAPSAILSPQYEWECQWMSENGLVGERPSYVNEAPQAIYSRDSTKVLLYFAASETYTSYYCEGMAVADADGDLTDPSLWKKLSRPVFGSDSGVSAYGAGHISFFNESLEDNTYIVYQAYSDSGQGCLDDRSPRMQKISWDEDGIPVLGTPIALGLPVPEPIINKNL